MKSYYKIDKSQVDLNSAIVDLTGYNKFLSILQLRKAGLPVLDGIILTKLDTESYKAVLDSCSRNKWSSVLLRHDKYPEKPPYPMGGYLVQLQNVKAEVTKYFETGRIVFLMEPVSPYDNSYNVNALFEEEGYLILEIVGPGFDASDLQRGQLSPHERIEIAEEALNKTPTPSLIKGMRRTFIIGEDTYQSSVRQRYLKIAKRLHEFNQITFAVDADEDKRIRLAKSYLKDHDHLVLLQNERSYKPIPIARLNQMFSYIRNLPQRLSSFASRPFVVSASFVQDGKRLVFWDVVSSKLKYAV